MRKCAELRGGSYQRQRSEGDREGDREGDEHTEEDEIDPYEVLGLTSHEASTGDVKSAYRKLALKWHPDKHADQPEEQQAEAEAMFHRLNLANAVLTDPVKRRMYDAGGRVRTSCAETRPARVASKVFRAPPSACGRALSETVAGLQHVGL